ncbi:MAG: hypothetical protein QE271_10645 [Bacteriovoracaceae bacterium]|nr:hypothetical protein [Bacteriovoracaceae bacterium]
MKKNILKKTFVLVLSFCWPLSMTVKAQATYCENDKDLYYYFSGKILTKISKQFFPKIEFPVNQSICQTTHQNVFNRTMAWTNYALNYLKNKNIPTSLGNYITTLSTLNSPYPNLSEAEFIANKFSNILPYSREEIRKLCLRHSNNFGVFVDETAEFNLLLEQLEDQSVQDPTVWETEKFVVENTSYEILVKGNVYYEEAALAVSGLNDYCLGSYPAIEANPEISSFLKNSTDFPSFLSKLAPNIQDLDHKILCEKNFVSMHRILSNEALNYISINGFIIYVDSLVSSASRLRHYILPSTWEDPIKKLKDVACHYAAYKANCQEKIPSTSSGYPFKNFEVALFSSAPQDGFEVTSQECQTEYQVHSPGIKIPGIAVSPNPFVDHFNINIPLFEKETSCSIVVGPLVSIDGKKSISGAKINQNLNPYQLQVTVDNVPAGVYEIPLTFSCKGNQFVKKIRLIKSAN